MAYHLTPAHGILWFLLAILYLIDIMVFYHVSRSNPQLPNEYFQLQNTIHPHLRELYRLLLIIGLCASLPLEITRNGHHVFPFIYLFAVVSVIISCVKSKKKRYQSTEP